MRLATTTAAALLAAIGAGAGAGAATDCGAGLPMRATAPGQADVFVAYGVVGEHPESAPERLPLNRHFQLELQICPARALPAPRVGADMPAHRHGMNYRATVRALPEPGRFLAEGLLLHMPGRWRLIVDLALPEGPLRLTQELDVR
jgi:hypothetical protein